VRGEAAARVAERPDDVRALSRHDVDEPAQLGHADHRTRGVAVIRGAALAPFLVEAMNGTMAEAKIEAPPIVTHQGLVTTFRSHDQMMAAFAADIVTGEWECDDEDRRKVAEWQAARMRKAPRPCPARRPRSRTSHRRATQGRCARSPKTCSSDPDGGSSEPPGSRLFAIRGALDVGATITLGDEDRRSRRATAVGGRVADESAVEASRVHEMRGASRSAGGLSSPELLHDSWGPQ